jgi:hypothetical protein
MKYLKMFESFDTDNIDDIIETTREILLDYEDNRNFIARAYKTNDNYIIIDMRSITKMSNYLNDINNKDNFINNQNIGSLERCIDYLLSMDYKLIGKINIMYPFYTDVKSISYNDFLEELSKTHMRVDFKYVELTFKNKLKS